MGLFGHEYKKKYDTQTSPINEAYAVPRSLNNLAYRYCRVKGADYSLLLREAQTNSIAGTPSTVLFSKMYDMIFKK